MYACLCSPCNAPERYGKLFGHLVSRLNATFAPDAGVGGGAVHIGILDMPGFENLAENGFDQLLINLAAEQLQEHFNRSLVATAEVSQREREINTRHESARVTAFDKKHAVRVSVLHQSCERLCLGSVGTGHCCGARECPLANPPFHPPPCHPPPPSRCTRPRGPLSRGLLAAP